VCVERGGEGEEEKRTKRIIIDEQHQIMRKREQINFSNKISLEEEYVESMKR